MCLEAETINCRVTQGAILGPLIFLLYINDIPQALSGSHTYLYVGDTRIFYQHKYVMEINNNSRNLQVYAYGLLTVSFQFMKIKSHKKIHGQFQYICRQNEFLSPKFCRFFCNSSIQPNFDYDCISWHPLVSHQIRTQKKSIKLNSRHHIGAKEFEETNWLPIKEKGRTMHYYKSFKY